MPARTTSRERERVVERLGRRAFRDAYVSEHIKSGVSFQIRANRTKRNLTQAQLGQLSNMKQGAICRLENPDHGLPNLQTLLRVASALDVALIVRFVAFSDLLNWTLGTDSLEVPSFKDDRDLLGQTQTPLPREISVKGSPVSHLSPLGAQIVVSKPRLSANEAKLSEASHVSRLSQPLANTAVHETL